MSAVPFSARFGLSEARPLIYDDAPLAFRHALLALLRDGFAFERPVTNLIQAGSGLPIPPGAGLEAARLLIEECAWARVYEIAEAAYVSFAKDPLSKTKHHHFERGINLAGHACGIGWIMSEGQFHVRGTDAEEATLSDVAASLELAGKLTTASELRAARDDLSRRPEPDVTGAIQHAGAALECLTRDLTGSKDTFGALIGKHPSLSQGAMRKIAEGVWGVVSTQGRHLKEGGEPSREEAILLVGLIASLVGYLLTQPERSRTPHSHGRGAGAAPQLTG